MKASTRIAKIKLAQKELALLLAETEKVAELENKQTPESTDLHVMIDRATKSAGENANMAYIVHETIRQIRRERLARKVSLPLVSQYPQIVARIYAYVRSNPAKYQTAQGRGVRIPGNAASAHH